MSDSMRFKIVPGPEADELLEHTVSAALKDLSADFDAASIGLKRRRVYRNIARELLAALAGHPSRAETGLSPRDELSNEDVKGIVDAVVQNIEPLHLHLSATAVEGFRKAVRAGIEDASARSIN